MLNNEEEKKENSKNKFNDYEGIEDEGTLIALRNMDELVDVDKLNKNDLAFWKEQKDNLIKFGKERVISTIFGKRNLDGKEYEKNNDIDNAIKQYEDNIADERVNTISDFPFYRLIIIYRRKRDYDNEIRVIEKILQLERSNVGLLIFSSMKIAEWKLRLKKTLLLKNKS